MVVYVLNNPLSFTDPSGFSAWTKWRKPIIGLVASILTAGVAGAWMSAYALANGATMFATAAGGLTNLGVAAAAAAGGFAAGGINGGNIQSALRGAFMAAVTAGVVQGVTDALGGAAGSADVAGSGAIEHLTAGGDSVAQTINSTPNLPSQMQIPVSDALPLVRIEETWVITAPKYNDWVRNGLDWLANGPSDRSTIGGVIWMSMIASSGGRLSGVGRGASTAAVGAAGSPTTRVGRWMSEAEFKIMNETNRVVEGAGGRTYVVNPANPSAYTSAGRGSPIYAEFDVPTEVLKAGSKPGWSVIPGPNVTTRLYGPAPAELAPAACIACIIRRP